MRSNKKGFTIVELVIVIAVIAILAAVLIPTIAGLVKKANISADKQAVRQMNTALAELGKEFNGIEDVVNALDAQGYNSKKVLAPVTKGYKFVWVDGDYDTIILVDEAGKLVFSNNKKITDEAIANVNKYDFDEISTYIVAEPATEADVKAALEGGVKNINLTDDVVVDAEIVIPAGADVTLNLGGNKYSTSATNAGTTAQTSKYIKVSEGASLTIENGTFEGRGIMNYGELTIKAGTVINAVDVNGGGCIRNKPGAKITIEGGEFNVPNHMAWGDSNNGGAAGIHNDNAEVIINGGTFTSNTDAYLINNVNGAKMTINGGTFTAFRGALYASDSEVVVNGGDFSVTNDSNGGWVACQQGTGSITLNGGTFTHVVAGREFCGVTPPAN